MAYELAMRDRYWQLESVVQSEILKTDPQLPMSVTLTGDPPVHVTVMIGLPPSASVVVSVASAVPDGSK
jgi:hypothetical protein